MIKQIMDFDRKILPVLGVYLLLAVVHATGLTANYFNFWVIVQYGFVIATMTWRVRVSNVPIVWLVGLYSLNFFLAILLMIHNFDLQQEATKIAFTLCLAGLLAAITIGNATVGFASVRLLLITITPILLMIFGYSLIKIILPQEHLFKYETAVTLNLIFVSIIVFAIDRGMLFKGFNMVVFLFQAISCTLGVLAIAKVLPFADYAELQRSLVATSPSFVLTVSSFVLIATLLAVYHSDNEYINDYLVRFLNTDHTGFSSYLNYLFLSIWLLFIGGGFGGQENRIIAATGMFSAFIVLWQFRMYRASLLETNAKLTDLANTDALTSVLNRQGLERKWRELDSRDITVLFVDLDKFKPVNDTHGHNIGDKVLQTIGNRLLESVRDTDLVCRWGGDEFVVLCPELDHERALRMSRRLSSRIADPMHIEAGPTILMGATIGLATVNSRDDLTTSLEQADRDMYQKKRDSQQRERVTKQTSFKPDDAAPIGTGIAVGTGSPRIGGMG